MYKMMRLDTVFPPPNYVDHPMFEAYSIGLSKYLDDGWVIIGVNRREHASADTVYLIKEVDDDSVGN